MRGEIKSIMRTYFGPALDDGLLKYTIETGQNGNYWLTVEYRHVTGADGENWRWSLLCAQAVGDYITETGAIKELKLVRRITLMLADKLRSMAQDVEILMREGRTCIKN